MFLSEGFGDSSLGIQSLLSLLAVLLIGLSGGVLDKDSVGVQSLEGLDVAQRVLLLDLMEGLVLVGDSDDILDLIGVDDSGQVGVGQQRAVQLVALLLLSGFSVRTENVVQGLEGAGGPDDESAQLATRSELSEVQTVHVADLDSGNVAEGLGELDVLMGVDHQGTLSQFVSSASHLALAGSESLVLDDLGDVFVGAESLQEANGVLGLFIALELVVDDQWKLRDVFNTVASGHNQGKQGGGGQGGGHCVSFLLQVHFSVP